MIIRDGVLIRVGEADIVNGTFVIPNDVTSIRAYAFENCGNLTEIIIPQNVTSIGDNAFEYCGLKKVTILEGVTSIGHNAFSGCYNLAEIIMPKSLTTIGDGAFRSCYGLKEITIPENVTRIGVQTFWQCSQLTKVNISKNVMSIGSRAFYECARLTEIIIPKGVTTIGNGAFDGCVRLERITIPESISSIGKEAFAFVNLEEINIPESVTEISKEVFKFCRLKSIMLYGEKIIFSEYEMRKQIQSEKIDRLVQIIKADKVQLYKELENLENGVPVNQTQKRTRLRNLISIAFCNADFGTGTGEDIEEAFNKINQRIQLWLDKKFIPSENVFLKVPLEKVEKFDKTLWFKLAREPIFDISEESKMALVELAYVFGIFEKDVYEVRGRNVSEAEIALGDKRSGNVEDYQKRLQQILRMVHEGKLNNENLHIMFDGTNMEYNPAFYRFFLDNEEAIFNSPDLMQDIPKIQREMPKIMSKYDGRIPTIEECERYFAEMVYEGVAPGNSEFAVLCKYSGITQERFEKYQNLYELQKQREKESTIPQIQNKNYRILELTDPRALLIGEGNFSKCCQKLGGLGEECMRHSVLSENGRLFEVFDDDGRLLAQSWVWRNGNVVCFDSIEANAISQGRYSSSEKEELIDKVELAYREAAKQMIEEAEKQINIFRERKLAEIEAMNISEKEKIQIRKQLARICDESRIKRVTVGGGYWEISKKISSRFSSRIVDTTNGRVIPREKIEYIKDSDIQYVVAEVEDTKEIKTNEAQVGVRFRDKRKIRTEEGHHISESTIQKIKVIGSQAYNSQMMEEINSIEDLSELYSADSDKMKIIHGEDWYYVYSSAEKEIRLHDLSRGISRFEDEKIIGIREFSRGLDLIIGESVQYDKPIVAELREDTSYIEFLVLMRNGYLEQIGNDVTYELENEYGKKRVVSLEEQDSMIEKRHEMRKSASGEENVTVHKITFKPTEKYKRLLERRKLQSNDR